MFSRNRRTLLCDTGAICGAFWYRPVSTDLACAFGSDAKWETYVAEAVVCFAFVIAMFHLRFSCMAFYICVTVAGRDLRLVYRATRLLFMTWACACVTLTHIVDTGITGVVVMLYFSCYHIFCVVVNACVLYHVSMILACMGQHTIIQVHELASHILVGDAKSLATSMGAVAALPVKCRSSENNGGTTAYVSVSICASLC